MSAFPRNTVAETPCPCPLFAFYLGKGSKKADMGSLKGLAIAFGDALALKILWDFPTGLFVSH